MKKFIFILALSAVIIAGNISVSGVGFADELDVIPKARPSTSKLGLDTLIYNFKNNTWKIQINEDNSSGYSIEKFYKINGVGGELVGVGKPLQVNMTKLKLLGKAKLIEAAGEDEALYIKLVNFGYITE